jgi:peptidyl-prolyl cis-trans isomerase D
LGTTGKAFCKRQVEMKYDNLLSTSEYANSKEGKLEHKMENSIADVDHLFIPFYAISDSLVEVSDSELKAYITKYPEKFQVKNAADLEYVSFDLTPSAEDSAAVINEMKRLTEELRNSDADSSFAIRNSDGQTPFAVIAPGEELPNTLTSNVDDIQVGETYGPFLTNRSSYITHKVTSKFEGTPRMKAAHILFGTQDMSDDAKAEVRQNAENVLKEIQNGLDFATAAAQYGQDGTAQRGGDLGWFAKADFVEAFADVSFAAKSTGLINRLVETEYGYHIISVTELPQTTSYKIASIELELGPSDVTRNEVFRQADSLQLPLEMLRSLPPMQKKEDIESFRQTV